MRKPLVVVLVAASALVIAGGVATAAGAQETPQFPDVPGFTWPDLPGLPQFGDSSDSGDGSGSGAADPAGSDGGSDAVTDPAADSGDSDFGDGSGSGGDSDFGDGSDSGDQAGAPVRDPQRPAAQHAAAAQPARPHAQSRPGLGFAQQPTAGSIIAASRESVTGADVSSSPSAPVQQQVLTLVNLNRRRGGCGDLSLDRRLIVAANNHAVDMARHDYFAHESRNGDGAGDRVSEAGYQWKRYGENIARGVDSAYEVVDGWMHSPEHRHNILDCRLDQMGIGLAIAGDRTVYWVQDFATPQ